MSDVCYGSAGRQKKKQLNCNFKAVFDVFSFCPTPAKLFSPLVCFASAARCFLLLLSQNQLSLCRVLREVRLLLQRIWWHIVCLTAETQTSRLFTLYSVRVTIYTQMPLTFGWCGRLSECVAFRLSCHVAAVHFITCNSKLSLTQWANHISLQSFSSPKFNLSNLVEAERKQIFNVFKSYFELKELISTFQLRVTSFNVTHRDPVFTCTVIPHSATSSKVRMVDTESHVFPITAT